MSAWHPQWTPYAPGDVVAVYVVSLQRWRRAVVLHASFGAIDVVVTGEQVSCRVPATPRWVRRVRLVPSRVPIESPRGAA